MLSNSYAGVKRTSAPLLKLEPQPQMAVNAQHHKQTTLHPENRAPTTKLHTRLDTS
jgi:hypothetical protein